MNTPVKTYTNSWIMAFDFGMQRIGVAIGNTQLKIPHPIDTVIGKSKFEKMDKRVRDDSCFLWKRYFKPGYGAQHEQKLRGICPGQSNTRNFL